MALLAGGMRASREQVHGAGQRLQACSGAPAAAQQQSEATAALAPREPRRPAKAAPPGHRMSCCAHAAAAGVHQCASHAAVAFGCCPATLFK